MKHRSLLVAFAGWVCLTNAFAAETQYRFLKEIPIEGEGDSHHLLIDPAAHRLYVTHATKIVVIDTEREAVVGEIADTPGVQGFAVAPELARGFSSNGAEAKASIVDIKSLKTIQKVPTGENPAAILYEPQRQEVYVFNAHGRSATVFEAKTGKVIATIPLSGKPKFAVADARAGFVYCNIEDKSEIAVIEAQTHTVAETWPLAPGKEPSGLALDLAHHRLFSGCANELLMMIDSMSGRVVGSVSIGKHGDAVVFDPSTQLVFSSNGEGTVTIARETSPSKLDVVQRLQTERDARTIALDPVTHRIYLTTAKFEQLHEGATQSPKAIDGTTKVLVYGPEK